MRCDNRSVAIGSRALQIAEAVPEKYPMNSGHSGLRGFRGANTERSLTAAQYKRIADTHGMAGVGSAGSTSYDWIQSYSAVMQAMGPGGIGGFGTDTNGLAIGMPARRGSSVRYDASYPKSHSGTRDWDYNRDGVVHYGMLSDFLKDARTAPNGAALIDNNLMKGAQYFVDTWKKCERLKNSVR